VISASIYQEWIVETGKQPELFVLLSFLVTFAFIRTSAHLIRAQVKWWPGNVSVGGTHVHHLVWGILLMLVVGYVAIAIGPGSPLREILAVLFGVGAGLTLDEFALWLNLKDVYWSEQGRASIDAVIVASGLAGLVLVGLRAWLDVADEVEVVVRIAIGSAIVLHVGLALVNALKGKYASAAAGLALPVVGVISAMRLARPDSLWARIYGSAKRERAAARYGKHATIAISQPSVQ
jgi:hypothetical protein